MLMYALPSNYLCRCLHATSWNYDYAVIIAYIVNAMYAFYNLAILDIEYDNLGDVFSLQRTAH